MWKPGYVGYEYALVLYWEIRLCRLRVHPNVVWGDQVMLATSTSLWGLGRPGYVGYEYVLVWSGENILCKQQVRLLVWKWVRVTNGGLENRSVWWPGRNEHRWESVSGIVIFVINEIQLLKWTASTQRSRGHGLQLFEFRTSSWAFWTDKYENL